MVHAAVQRERDEPLAGREPLSLWLVALYGFALFGGAFYMGRYSGDFRGDSLDPAVGQQLAIRSGVAKSASENKVGGHSVDERPNSSAAGQAALVTVLIRNMQYSPALLEVKKGDVVEWKNDDLTPHTVTSPAFDSGSIEPEKSWRHTFTDDGDFPYACTFHPDMKARVVAK
jgi:plastocyanin